MRSETQQTGRRRRGGRRHRGPRHSNGSPNGQSPNGSPRNGASPATRSNRTPEKPRKGFFARLLALIFGEPKKEEPGKVYGRVLDGSEERPSRTARRDNGERPGKPASETKPVRAAEASGEPRQPKGFRKPELVEVTSPKLYVGNLSFDATESDLTELFAGAGQVRNSEVVCHRETQKSKGFAFVTMATVDEAKRAVTELHDKEFMGRRLVVSGAKTPDVRDAEI